MSVSSIKSENWSRQMLPTHACRVPTNNGLPLRDRQAWDEIRERLKREAQWLHCSKEQLGEPLASQSTRLLSKPFSIPPQAAVTSRLSAAKNIWIEQTWVSWTKCDTSIDRLPVVNCKQLLANGADRQTEKRNRCSLRYKKTMQSNWMEMVDQVH